MQSKFFDSLYIPASKKGFTNGEKIMVLLHGLGDQKETYKLIAQEIHVTGLQYLCINAPEKYVVGYSWYDLESPMPKIRQNRALLNNLIDELKEKGFKSEDIFLLGFSQGGAIVVDHFLQAKESLGGVIALSPRIYFEDEWQKSFTQKDTPLFMAHGLQDQQILFSETSANFKEINSVASNTEWHEYNMGHEIDPTELQHLRDWLNELL